MIGVSWTCASRLHFLVHVSTGGSAFLKQKMMRCFLGRGAELQWYVRLMNTEEGVDVFILGGRCNVEGSARCSCMHVCQGILEAGSSEIVMSSNVLF